MALLGDNWSSARDASSLEDHQEGLQANYWTTPDKKEWLESKKDTVINAQQPS